MLCELFNIRPRSLSSRPPSGVWLCGVDILTVKIRKQVTRLMLDEDRDNSVYKHS